MTKYTIHRARKAVSRPRATTSMKLGAYAVYLPHYTNAELRLMAKRASAVVGPKPKYARKLVLRYFRGLKRSLRLSCAMTGGVEASTPLTL